MKRTIVRCSALAGLALSACGQDVGGSAAALEWVDEAAVEQRADLYVDPAVSFRPATLDALGHSPTAVPVTIDVSGGVAVAFLRDEAAPAGTHATGDVVAVYRVLDRLEGATPIRNDQLDGSGAPIVVPGESTFGGTIDHGGSPDGPEGDKYLGTPGNFVLIDWTDRSNIPPQDDVELWRELHESHPGCA